MKIGNVCILTKNVKRLLVFYRMVLCMEPCYKSLHYVEFEIGEVKLAIYSLNKHNEMVKKIANIVDDKNIMIEIEVENVDFEYQRICDMGVQIVKELSIQAWGSKSFYFTDPDGNLIDFYSKL